GAWGNNIRLEVDYDTLDPSQMFNLTAVRVDLTTGQPVQTETFRNLTFEPGAPTYAPDVVNQSSQLIRLSPPPGSAFPNAAQWTSAYRPAETGTVGAALTTPVKLPSDNDTFHVKVSADGSTANTATFTATMSLGGATLSDYASVIPYLQAAIRAAPAAPVNPPPSPQLAAMLAPLLSGATVLLVGSGSTAPFRVLAGRGGSGFNPLASMTFDTFTGSKNDLGLGTAAANAQQYSLGLSDSPPANTSVGAQKGLASKGGIGADGGLPG